jgi:hypothetical protein
LINPALCTNKNDRRTITALSFNASAISAEVSIPSGFSANTESTFTPN